MEKDKYLKILSGMGAVLSISGSLVTVGLFLKNLYYGVVPFNIESAFPWLFAIVLIFMFSMLLYQMASADSEVLDTIIIIFSWLYVILSALMFVVISKQFIIEANYGIYDYIGYIFVIFLIAGLGFIISMMIGNSLHNFSIPFMLVGLYQILLWVSLCFNPQTFVFNVHSFGNALLLAVVGVLIVYCRKD
ncbi:hypothetical protein [uncultured Methanolobus sp.]|uniref:hypothetical protein n=1 Tax=uncultured Methanolobus sp. TaxID=218300 RepID=UPI0029C8A7C0|nr:hypothetical protein [uncultured Methanolobus sp.]